MDNITIRKIEETDLELIKQIPLLIHERYGNSYVNAEFYDINVLAKKIKERKLTLCGGVAENGELLGIEGAGESPFFENACLFQLRMVKKAYSGKMLGNRISSRLFEVIDESEYSCAYAHTRTNSKSSIQNLQNHGFVSTGKFIGDCLTSENIKRSHIIMVKPLKKRNAGKIFVVDSLISQIADIYDKLGVTVQLCKPESKMKTVEQLCEYWYYPNHRHLLVKLSAIEENSGEYVLKLIEKYCREEFFSADIMINMNDERCLQICNQLFEQGLVFTGIQPLCTQGEFIVLHFKGKEDYLLKDGEENL